MPRKPSVPEVVAHARAGMTGLAVKDGLREVRFNVRHEARKLVQAVAAATHRTDDEHRGPMTLLGEPLNLAVRTAASLLNHVDLAAVDLLAPDAAYRAMDVALHASGAYFSGPARADDRHAFTTDHHWRLRHWLALTQREDVFVHEQEIESAGAQVAQWVLAAPGEPVNDGLAEADSPSRASALVVQALIRQRIFSRPALSGNDDEDELAECSRIGGVVVVLAGEIAASLSGLCLRDRYAHALELADEIASADRKGWESALSGRAPTQALMRWFAFVLRHL